MKPLSFFKNKHSQFNNSIIYLILIPYLIIFFFFVLYGSFTSSFLKNKVQNEINIANKNAFNTIVENISFTKQGIDLLSIQLSKNQNLISIANRSFWDNGDTFLEIKTLKDTIASLSLPYTSITSTAVFFPKSNNFFIDGGVFTVEDKYEKYYFSNLDSDNISLKSWKNFILAPHNFEMYKNENGNIFYVHSVVKSNNIIAIIILDIDEEIFKKFKNPEYPNAGIIVYNHLNEIIFFEPENTDNNNPISKTTPHFEPVQNEVVIDAVSYKQFHNDKITKLNLTYYMKVNEIYKSAKESTIYIYIVLLIFLLPLITLAIYSTKFHHHSISNIVNKIKEKSFEITQADSSNNKNEYNYIEESIKIFSEKITQNEIKLRSQKKLASLSSIKKYLTTVHDFQNLSNILEGSFIDFSFKKYIAVLITINYIDEDYWLFSRGDDTLIFSAIENLFNDFYINKFSTILIPTNETTAFMLIGTNSNAEHIINDIGKSLVKESSFCNDKLKFSFFAHISEEFNDINKTKTIYENIYHSQYVDPENVVTLHSVAIKNNPLNFYVLEKVETELQKALEDIDFIGAEKFLEKIALEYLQKPVSNTFLYYINTKILNVFLNFSKNINPQATKDYIKLISKINPFSASYKDFIGLAKFCSKNTSLDFSRNVQFSDEIIKYVDEHFAESSLNVNTLSYNFGKSPSYISSLFKTETNKLLNQYISEIRLQHAKKLLKTRKKIDDICKECGFSDVGTFRRIFKRYEGVSPAEYRKIYKQEN